MSKGTASMGLRSKGKNMVFCRRCGKKTYHTSKKKCSSCGYGASTRLRKYKWKKARK